MVWNKKLKNHKLMPPKTSIDKNPNFSLIPRKNEPT